MTLDEAVDWLKTNIPPSKWSVEGQPISTLMWWHAMNEAEALRDCGIRDLAEYIIGGMPALTIEDLEEALATGSDGAWEDDQDLIESLCNFFFIDELEDEEES